MTAKPAAMPKWHVFSDAIAGIEAPGDLFYVDAEGSDMNISATLYLTNAGELIHCYRYMIMKVGVYAQTGSAAWEKATSGNGEPNPDAYVTLRNSRASFRLAGGYKYKIAIDEGSMYSLPVSSAGGDFSPEFYLAVE